MSGKIGAVYSIQSVDDLSRTNDWTELTLFQVQGTNDIWTDTSTLIPRRRFYRLSPVPPPTDPTLAFIPPGTFVMGSPTSESMRYADETQHTVTISRGFWMGKYLVTQKGYLIVVGNNPSFFAPYYDRPLDPTLPVETVTWFDATNYCALRTQEEHDAGLLPANYAYRLPTESEWEYAARAGTTTAFYLGNQLYSGQANIDGKYNYNALTGPISNPGGIYLWETTPVGSYSSNPWGLYDMIGNVYEWCQDWYDSYPPGPVTDPQGAVSGSNRIARGGDFFRAAWTARSAQRSYFPPAFKESGVGFRVVLAPVQP
ncbi:MAG TPA: formylglycine-generating enzyme family protein [Verrucomicrobiae bacterium]